MRGCTLGVNEMSLCLGLRIRTASRREIHTVPSLHHQYAIDAAQFADGYPTAEGLPHIQLLLYRWPLVTIIEYECWLTIIMQAVRRLQQATPVHR